MSLVFAKSIDLSCSNRIANFLDIALEFVDPNCLDEFPKLRKLMDDVLGIPEIQEWRKLQEIKALQRLAENA